VKYRRTNTLHKPVLDHETFQQLLAAAYTLQAQNDRKLGKKASADYPETLHDAVPRSRHRIASRRVSQSDELFSRVATLTAMAAVSALVLIVSVGRLSPLPSGLEAVQQEVPFRRAVAAKSVVVQPEAARITDGMVEADGQHGTTTNLHATCESEADVVAPDTVVRYDTRSVVPRAQVHVNRSSLLP
jgi:hypothetical protein